MDAGDALGALLASLHSEREWRNIQTPVESAVRRLVHVVAAQQRQLEALEAARSDQLRAIETRDEGIRRDIARELTDAIHTGHAQLTERVCAHVDAQRDELEKTWTERYVRREEVQRLVEEASRSNGHKVDDSAVDAVERKLKRLEKQQHTAESSFTSQWHHWKEEITKTLQSKASQLELHAAVDAQTQAVVALREQLDSCAAADCASRWETQRSTQIKMDDELRQLKTHMHELLGIVETLQNEQTMLKTLTIDHVQSNGNATHGEPQTSETKRAVLKLHDAVKSVRRSVESVAKRAELEALSEQVAWLRKQLRSEIYQARYIWKEGRPTPKQTIAWSAQVVNTNSDVFVWQSSTGDAVTTTVPGLYHLQAAFFTSLAPVLQVLVNGEPALITTGHDIDDDENSPTDRQNQTKSNVSIRRRRLHHSAGDLVGVEIAAFLALPARSVVTISYDIDERAQGFMNLRKL